jgi:hypothetical protein
VRVAVRFSIGSGRFVDWLRIEQVRTDGWLFTVMMCLAEREMNDGHDDDDAFDSQRHPNKSFPRL